MNLAELKHEKYGHVVGAHCSLMKEITGWGQDWQALFTWLWRWLTLMSATNSSFQNYPQPEDHTIQTIDNPGFKPFTRIGDNILIVCVTMDATLRCRLQNYDYSNVSLQHVIEIEIICRITFWLGVIWQYTFLSILLQLLYVAPSWICYS